MKKLPPIYSFLAVGMGMGLVLAVWCDLFGSLNSMAAMCGGILMTLGSLDFVRREARGEEMGKVPENLLPSLTETCDFCHGSGARLSDGGEPELCHMCAGRGAQLCGEGWKLLDFINKHCLPPSLVEKRRAELKARGTPRKEKT